MIVRPELSLRRPSWASAVWYAGVLGGWPLIVLGVWHVASSTDVAGRPALALTAALIVVLELFPLVHGDGHDPQGVVMSSAFVMAMLLIWGIWPAVAMVALASLVADLQARKSLWKVLFNPAQYALSVAAAAAVLVLAGRSPTMTDPATTFTIRDLGWTAAAWVTYFVVNLGVVAGVLTYAGRFVDIVRADLWYNAGVTFAVLCLSPLVVVLSDRSWTLIPLLLVPLVLTYYTARLSVERELSAGRDALTGLPNRRTLEQQLDQLFAAGNRPDVSFGLLMVDIDDFKRINDTLGHQIGDELLITFARRLRGLLRVEDLVVRLGSDHFAVLVRDAAYADVLGVAERVVAAQHEPIELDGMFIEVELSIGIAMYPDHADNRTDLLRRADVALYAAKNGQVGLSTYAPDRDDNSTARLSLLTELRRALDTDELELHYQPKLAGADGRIMGFEGLLRWTHPTRGAIPPDHFIPLAERSGIMPRLTARVIDLAAAQLAEWRHAGLEAPISVNVSPSDLLGNDLVDLLADKLVEHDITPGMLQLEITERVVTHEVTESRRTLNRLRRMGISISLDDFGTGYSSLLRLGSLPVDELKIDRAFVAMLDEDERGTGIVSALVRLAHALGLPAIAEGVETARQFQLLRELGCDGMQGWHIARPMCRTAASAWMRQRPTLDPAGRLTRPASPTLTVFPATPVSVVGTRPGTTALLPD